MDVQLTKCEAFARKQLHASEGRLPETVWWVSIQ